VPPRVRLVRRGPGCGGTSGSPAGARGSKPLRWTRPGRCRSCGSISPDTGNNEKTAARVGKPSGAKSLCRMPILRTKPSWGFALQRSCCNMEHDMSTSAPARVKPILVVDLTHVLNGPFGTTILGDLRARLIPPTRVGGPNGQPPESSHLERSLEHHSVTTSTTGRPHDLV
jgi:hypothetical protein